MKNLWILLLIFFLILSSGCQGNSSSYDQENQIIFFEYWEEFSSEVLSGVGSPPLMIDFPTYRYEAPSNSLISYLGIFGSLPENINPFEVPIILGNGFTLNGDAGSGATSSLKGIGDLPYYPGPPTPYFLADWNEKGSIHIKPLYMISFMDVSLKNPLPPEGAWVDPGNTLIFTNEEIQATALSTIRYTYKLTLKNYLVLRNHCLNSSW